MHLSLSLAREILSRFRQGRRVQVIVSLMDRDSGPKVVAVGTPLQPHERVLLSPADAKRLATVVVLSAD